MDSTSQQPDPAQPSRSPEEADPRQEEGMRRHLGRLGEQYQFLETIFALTVSAVILMTVGIDLYIFKQMRLARAQAQRQRQLIQPALDSFRSEREPMIRSFVNKLQAFATTHPDFEPILEKYRKPLGFYFVESPPSLSSAAPASSPAATNQ